MRTFHQTRGPDFIGNFKPGSYPVINDVMYIDNLGPHTFQPTFNTALMLLMGGICALYPQPD